MALAKDKELRGPAVSALGKVGPEHAEKVIPTLVKALDVSDIQDKDYADRIIYNAIRSMEQLGPAAKVALPELEKVLKDPNTEAGTRIAVERLIKKMRP